MGKILRSQRSLAVVTGMKKRMIMQNRQKVKCLKNKNNCNFSDNQNLCTGIEVIVSLA